VRQDEAGSRRAIQKTPYSPVRTSGACKLLANDRPRAAVSGEPEHVGAAEQEEQRGNFTSRSGPFGVADPESASRSEPPSSAGGPAPLMVARLAARGQGPLDRPAPGGPQSERTAGHAHQTTARRRRAREAPRARPTTPARRSPATAQLRGMAAMGPRPRRGGLARLSLNNQLLVALSRPEARFVAGFKAWLELGVLRAQRREGDPDRRPDANQAHRRPGRACATPWPSGGPGVRLASVWSSPVVADPSPFGCAMAREVFR
jgi:hypothetical protein